MARSSRRLARSLPLLALPLPLRPSLSLFRSPSFFPRPPPPSNTPLPCASGRRFRKRIRSRFRTRKTAGAGAEHGQIRIETRTPSGGGSERRKEEEEADGSQRAVQVLIALLGEGLNQRFFFFFFKERDFFRCLAGGSSRVQRRCRRLLRGRERKRDRRAGDEEGEEKVKSLRGEPLAFATKNWGAGGARCLGPRAEGPVGAEQRGSGASRPPARPSPPPEPTCRGGFLNTREARTVTPRPCLPIARLAPFKSSVLLPQRH